MTEVAEQIEDGPVADHVYAELKNVGANTRVVYDMDGKMIGIKPGQTLRLTLSNAMFKRIQGYGDTLIAEEADPLADEQKAGPVSILLAEAPDLSYHQLLSKASGLVPAEELGNRPKRAQIIDVLRQHATTGE